MTVMDLNTIKSRMDDKTVSPMSEQERDTLADLRTKSTFLRDYTTELYASGATTIRIEQNLIRIAETWGTKADFSILPTCLVLTLWNKDETLSYDVVGKIPADRLNFNTITELSKLSWEIHEGNLDVDTARLSYNAIVHQKRLNPWLVLTLTSFANASFCALFGGDFQSMAIVFLATFNGFFLKQRLPETGLDYRAAILISACAAAIISCAGYVFGIGTTPEIALATSVLYLVPGIPFCNAVCDLIYGHYICSISRFCQAMIITICLSLGLCVSFFIMHLQFV